MELPDTSYRRVKWLVGLYFVLFILALVVEASTVPEEADVTFSEYPAAAATNRTVALFLLIGIPIAGYYISKDKRELSKQLGPELPQHWPTATQSKSVAALFRHPLTTIILSFFTFGFYSLYYVLLRWRFNSQTNDIGSIGGQQKESKDQTNDIDSISGQQKESKDQTNDIDSISGQQKDSKNQTNDINSISGQQKESKKTFEQAKQAARDNRYREAVNTASHALETLPDKREVPGNEERQRNMELKQTIQSVMVDWELKLAKARFGEAERAAQRDDYEQAIDITADISMTLTGIENSDKRRVTGSGIDEFQNTVQRYRRDWVEHHARSLLEQSERAADDGDYDQAVTQATEIVERLETAIEQAEGENLDTDSLEALLEQTTEHRTEWEREQLVSRINEAMEAEPSAYERASRALQEVLSDLPESDALSESERNLLEREARDAYVTVRARGATQVLEEGTEQIATGDHATGRDTLRKAMHIARNTLDTADEWDDVDTAELETVRDEAATAYAEAQVSQVEAQFATGIEQFERGDYEQANETFAAVSDEATEARDRIDREDRTERLTEIADAAQENAEAAQRAALGLGSGEPEPRRLDEDTGTDEVSSPANSIPASPSRNDDTREPPAEIPAAFDIDIEHEDLSRQGDIGKGGNADVYLATASVDGQTYDLAVKEPRLQGTISTQVVEEFVREAETWSKLDDHDHIVGVVDWGTRPLPWIGMEYMDGGDLSERLDTVSFREGVWIAQAATEAILHAHRRGAAHLDLKPENILFQHTGEDSLDVPKVADWGLAKMLLDHSNSIEGVTPRYAAPEQFDDATPVGQATDIYQLGAVCYELFTGEPPFTGSPIEVVQKIAEEPVTPPTELDPSLPTALDDALLPALAKETDDRYEDVVYLRDSLRGLSEESTPQSASRF